MWSQGIKADPQNSKLILMAPAAPLRSCTLASRKVARYSLKVDKYMATEPDFSDHIPTHLSVHRPGWIICSTSEWTGSTAVWRATKHLLKHRTKNKTSRSFGMQRLAYRSPFANQCWDPRESRSNKGVGGHHRAPSWIKKGEEGWRRLS